MIGGMWNVISIENEEVRTNKHGTSQLEEIFIFKLESNFSHSKIEAKQAKSYFVAVI